MSAFGYNTNKMEVSRWIQFDDPIGSKLRILVCGGTQDVISMDLTIEDARALAKELTAQALAIERHLSEKGSV